MSNQFFSKRCQTLGALLISLGLPLGVSAAPILYSTNGHYYEIVDARGTFDEAVKAASGKTHLGVSGHLVSLTDSTEQTFIQDNLKLQEGGIYWIGGKQAFGSKQWVTGETFTDLKKFAAKEPGSTDYGFSIGGSSYKYAWSGQAKDQKLGRYIVEYDTKLVQNQTLTFGALSDKTFGDASFDLTATASSQLPVSYTATGKCTVSSGPTVTLTGAGECSIAAHQAGNESYAATTVTKTFKIAQATQTLEFKPVTKGTVGQSATLSATASSGLTDFTFDSTPTSVCTVNGTQVSFKDAGTCAVTAKQAGNSNYLPVTANGKILVAAAPQVIKSDKTVTVNDPAFQVKANSNADLPVELTLDPQSTGICELNGDTVKPVSPGICLINAFQAGNATTNPAQAVYQFEITGGQIQPQEQNLSVQFSPATGIVGDVLTISATPGESGNEVTFASSTAETCSVQGSSVTLLKEGKGSSVTLLKEGTCTVTATQAGNAHYLEVSASSSVTVKTDKATFGLKVLSNKDNSGQLTQVSQADTVNIELQVTAAPKDVDKTTELFLTVKLGNDLYILTDSGWQPWNGVTWTRVTKKAFLTAEAITLPVFSGQLAISGTLEFSAAYRVEDSGALLQGTQPVGNLTVTAFNSVEQAKTDCLGKGGIYYAQQCFTDVKDLGNGFAGGIYVEGQPSLQTNADLACRLGKKVSVLGRFNTSATDIGKTAEVVLAFALGNGKIYQYDGSGFNELTDIVALSGKPIGALPAVYSAAFFEGELPTTGNFATFLGYRLLNSDGTKGELKYAGGLSLSAPIESCDNPLLKLNTLPLGMGKGEVITKTNDDGTVRLIATAATDGGAFAGWTGDAEGCKGSETTVTIKPSADKFTCQPTFSKQVLGTLKCVDGFDTEQNIACCDLKDHKCPAIPEPCNPPKDPTTKWLVGIPPSNGLDVPNIRVTNLSQENREVKATLYNMDGELIFENKTLVKADNLPPFAAVRLQMEDLTSNGSSWTGRAILKIPNPEGLLIQSFLRAREATGFPETPLMDETFASAKHRVTNIPPPKNGVIGADQMTIRITNIGDTKMKLVMRLFSQEGDAPRWVSNLTIAALLPMATIRFTSEDLGAITDWEGRAFAEIFPEDVKQRCNGKMLIQSVIRQNGIRMAPLSNVTPQD